MFFWTAEPMTAQGPRKGESSSRSMRKGFRTQPARSVRGSSRRILQTSSRMLLRCYRPCCPKQNKLKAHQQERVPTGAPVECVPSARTVLTVKGSLRRAKQRRALDCCAPFRPTSFATGGSGGNTKRSAKNKPRQPTCRT